MIQKIGMKIIFLNTWNGKMREGIADFLREQSADTDMFCLQEAYDGMREICHEILSDFTELTAYKFVVADDDFNLFHKHEAARPGDGTGGEVGSFSAGYARALVLAAVSSRTVTPSGITVRLSCSMPSTSALTLSP